MAPARADITPFHTTNQSPWVQRFGLPAPAGARLPARAGEGRLALDLSSNYSGTARGDEAILTDGETTRVTAVWQQSVTDTWAVGVELPYVVHDPGFLDGFVVDWHDTFGLPQGGRDTAPRRVLRYRYERAGTVVIDHAARSEGIGDVRFTAARSLGATARGATAVRASLKLPSGDSAALNGSGGADLAVWVEADRRLARGDYAWDGFGSVGVLALGRGAELADQQRHAVWFGGLGAGVRVSPLIDLKAQLDWHTAFYDSGLAPLGDYSIQLVVGGSVHVSPASRLDIGVAEDIKVDTAPDVSFHLGITQRF